MTHDFTRGTPIYRISKHALTERFAIARIRAHDLWHYHHRLIRKVLAYTIGVYLNLKFNRAPLDLDGLLSV
jgi:hypothetical protein